MKFGLCLDPFGGPPATATARLAEQARLARDWGFDSVWLDEGEIAPGGPSATAVVAAAAVAASVSAVRIGVVLPLGLTHPLYTAEDIAVLDNISAGRVIVAVRPPSGPGMGTATARERFGEALEVCLRAWAPVPFRFHGRHFHIPANLPENGHAASLAEISVGPKPAQAELPVWVMATDDDAVRTAARLALRIVGAPEDSPAGLRSKFELHRSAMGRESPGAPAALMRNMDVSDIEAIIADTERYRDDIGANYVICRLRRPGMSDEAFTEAIRRFGQSVTPVFRMFNYPRELRAAS